jgi:hypothetical protein
MRNNSISRKLLNSAKKKLPQPAQRSFVQPSARDKDIHAAIIVLLFYFVKGTFFPIRWKTKKPFCISKIIPYNQRRCTLCGVKMKFGFRKPSLKKSIAARTSIKRAISYHVKAPGVTDG